MISILFLCIKLSILHLGVSDLGYNCGIANYRHAPEIFLIQDRILETRTEVIGTNYQGQLNIGFKILCEPYYNIVRGSLEEAKRKKVKNVIYFAVTNYEKYLEDFVYAGNVSKIDNFVCHTNKTHPKLDCNEMANLVSKSLIAVNEGHIYAVVQKINVRADTYHHNGLHFDLDFTERNICEPFYRSTLDLTMVVLCLRESPRRQVNILPLQLIQISGDNCFDPLKYHPDVIVNRLLAVVAPEPFNIVSDYSIPTIFYESPYMFSDHKAAFPNSMNLVPWQLLKYGFLMFIQTVGWQRVAIVTDDSEYSIEFEDELTALFSKEQLVYTVIRCEDANCEMNKIAHELNRVSARIVIANVKQENAEYLFRNAPRRITWLVRDMARNSYKQYLSDNPDAFYFNFKDTKTKGCDVEDNILRSLSSIAQAYKNIANEDYELKKREFYKHFTDNTRRMIPRISEAIVVVNRFKNHDPEEISVIHVNESGATLISFENPFKSGKPNDGTTQCLVTSYDYHKPCADHQVMLLMFVVMIFVLTSLMITCYFDKTSPFNDIRYQNF